MVKIEYLISSYSKMELPTSNQAINVFTTWVLDSPIQHALSLIRIFKANKTVFTRIREYCAMVVNALSIFDMLYCENHMISLRRAEIVAARLSLGTFVESGSIDADIVNVISNKLFELHVHSRIDNVECDETFNTQVKIFGNILTNCEKYALYIKWLEHQLIYSGRYYANDFLLNILYKHPSCCICRSTFGLITNSTYSSDDVKSMHCEYYCAFGCTIRCTTCDFDNIDIKLEKRTETIFDGFDDYDEQYWSFRINCRKCDQIWFSHEV